MRYSLHERRQYRQKNDGRNGKHHFRNHKHNGFELAADKRSKRAKGDGNERTEQGDRRAHENQLSAAIHDLVPNIATTVIAAEPGICTRRAIHHINACRILIRQEEWTDKAEQENCYEHNDAEGTELVLAHKPTPGARWNDTSRASCLCSGSCSCHVSPLPRIEYVGRVGYTADRQQTGQLLPRW